MSKSSFENEDTPARNRRALYAFLLTFRYSLIKLARFNHDVPRNTAVIYKQ